VTAPGNRPPSGSDGFLPLLLPPGPFDHQPRTRLLFGPGTVDRLGEVLRELSVRRVLVVTDRGVAAAGHFDRARRAIEAAGMTVSVFDQVQENPTTVCVENCRQAAQNAGVDSLVGLGGGSSLDTAKGCNFLLTNGGHMQDYQGVGKAPRPMLPFVAVPTTAGTGSECQSFALISDEHTHRKMACGDPKAAARVAILDPLLTLSQPPRVAACTGLDALAHALETAVTTRRNPLSWLYSQEAFRLAVHAFPRVLETPDDLEARGAMLLAAAWAGTAIEASMLGAAHAAANPLTARYGITHGEAVALMLPEVIRFNAKDPAAAAYAALLRAARPGDPAESPASAAGELACLVEALRARAGLARSLAQHGVRAEAIPQLAEDASRQWTATFNPRPLGAFDFAGLYRAALGAA
jgi:alcohol dehydrogenase